MAGSLGNLAALYEAQGKLADAEALSKDALQMYKRLHKALFLDASPAPTKFALAHLGLCAEDCRLPIVPASEASRTEVLAAMRDAGVI